MGKILKLRVTKEQKEFVASNKWSLIEAYLALAEGETALPFGIYNGKTLIGFVMLSYDDDWTGYERENWMTSEVYKRYEGIKYYAIWRFMIDKKHQNKGYGREALKVVIDLIRTLPCGEAQYILLSYEPENVAAKRLYHSFGFEEPAEFAEYYEEGDEITALLKL
ncbi:MAG: GNAT family N-acetyltransferase [Erysipelotrichaceae bacterium]|nr:GNAT family N-acetyltransferase [Erysipelotrichaceae bacterium]